ncbi:CD151 antigen-like isoform X2 [Limulus polyphemus]|nr:CD151 antigen-like isoform X2 [Limulus polyphemus]XP_022252495.1 CD151 antigen-like isoform X2 [Limulus polyphemus]
MATYVRTTNEGCCSVSFLKFVLHIFNFIFFLAGCAVLGVGLWTVIDKHHYVNLLTTSTYVATSYILIIAGITVLIVTVIGCIAVRQEDRCLLLIYTFLLLLIFLLEAVAGVIAYVYQEQVISELEISMNGTFTSQYQFDESRTAAIDRLQRKYKCCGALGFEDWHYSRWLKENPEEKRKVPDSCCKTETLSCGVRDHPSNIHDVGCIRALERQIKDHLNILGGVGLGICLVQVFGMILSCCLYMTIRDYIRPKKHYNYER